MYLRFNVRREVLFLILYTVLCNLAAMNIGAVTGYSSVIFPILTSNTSSITLNIMEESLFVSINYLSQMIGILLCFITMNYGRRSTLIVCGIIFSMGWILIASSYSVTQLLIGRMLTGIAVGTCSSSVTIYLSEISIFSWREVITITPVIAFSVGLLIVFLVGYIFENNWRLIATLFAIPSILFMLFSIFFIRESPKWLIMKGRKNAARIALLQIRGLRQETIEFRQEFDNMVNYNEIKNNFEISRNCQSDSLTKAAEKKSSPKWNIWNKLKSFRRMILLPEVWKPSVILNLYFFFQQFCGLYVIMSYTVDVITTLNITENPFLITLIIGIIQVVVQVMTAYCSKKIGRRTIAIVSGAGTSISLGTLLMYLQFFEDTGVTAVPLVCIFFYMGFGSFGFHTLPWSMMEELYPTKYINVLATFTTFFAKLCTCIVVQVYPMMVMQSRNATFYFYCIISIIATIFLTVALPETRGKTKTEIEEAFRCKLQIDETFKKIDDI